MKAQELKKYINENKELSVTKLMMILNAEVDIKKLLKK